MSHENRKPFDQILPEPVGRNGRYAARVADKQRTNNLTGTLMAEFAENLWVLVSGDKETISLAGNVISRLYTRGLFDEAFDVIQLLYALTGLQFPMKAVHLSELPGEKGYFLFSFLLDFDDAIGQRPIENI